MGGGGLNTYKIAFLRNLVCLMVFDNNIFSTNQRTGTGVKS